MIEYNQLLHPIWMSLKLGGLSHVWTLELACLLQPCSTFFFCSALKNKISRGLNVFKCCNFSFIDGSFLAFYIIDIYY